MSSIALQPDPTPQEQRSWISGASLPVSRRHLARLHKQLAPHGWSRRLGRGTYLFDPIAPPIAAMLRAARPVEDLSVYTADQRADAERWVRVLEAASREIAGKVRDGMGRSAALEWFGAVRAPELGFGRIALRTLYRRLSAWEEAPVDRKVASQISRRGLRTGDADQCSPEAWQHFLALYLHQNRLTARTCWKLTKSKAHASGWAWLGYRACLLRVQRLPRPVVVAGREGDRALQTKCLPRIERDYSDVPSNHTWCGDECTLDFFCRVPDRKAADGWRRIRPRLTAWLDVRSRSWVGWFIGEHANTDTILAAFKAGVGTYGPPHQVYLDNGRDYKAAAGERGSFCSRAGRKPLDEACLAGVFGQLDIAITWAIPYSSWSKMIESHFRATHREFDKLWVSYTGSTTEQKPESLKDLAVMDCPTLDEVREAFPQFVHAFHAEPKQGDGMFGLSPSQAMERYKGDSVRQAPTGAALDYLCARRVGPVKVGRHGVRWQGICYGTWAESLYTLQGREVWLRVMADRADAVWVCDEHDRPICLAAHDRLRGTTQEHVREAARTRSRRRRATREYMDQVHAGLITDTPVAATLAALHDEHKSRQQAVAACEARPNVQVVRPDVQTAVQRAPLLVSSGNAGEHPDRPREDAFARLAGVDSGADPGQPMRMDWATAYADGLEDTAAGGGNPFDVLAQRGREESSYGYGTAG